MLSNTSITQSSRTSQIQLHSHSQEKGNLSENENRDRNRFSLVFSFFEGICWPRLSPAMFQFEMAGTAPQKLPWAPLGLIPVPLLTVVVRVDGK